MTEGRRTYRSALRDEQARDTRRRIVDAAGLLFVEMGYAATTIDAIAERAEVSRRTVFTSVGSKPEILKLAFDWTLAGDDEQIPIAERPVVRQLMRAEDPREILDPWLAMNAGLNERIADLHAVLVVAADADAEVAALLADSDLQRLDGATKLVDRIGEVGGLRPDVNAEEAAAILDVLIDPQCYRRFVGLHRWTSAVYVRHLQVMAGAAVLR